MIAISKGPSSAVAAAASECPAKRGDCWAISRTIPIARSATSRSCVERNCSGVQT
jgi:hypothetical protein